MKRIKSKFPLADIFNFVLGKLSVLKSISEPVTFSSRDNALSALYEEAYKLADTSLDRMQIEAEELNGRYVKLAAFIDSGKMDEVVNDMYNKCLLEMQCCTMFDYIRLLDTRIQRMQGSDGAKVIKMNFGMAIMALKAGYPIRRSGWNIDYLPPHIEEYPKYTPFERVEYNEEFDLTYILLNDGSVAVTDGVFYEKVSKHTWMKDLKGYAVSSFEIMVTNALIDCRIFYLIKFQKDVL